MSRCQGFSTAGLGAFEVEAAVGVRAGIVNAEYVGSELEIFAQAKNWRAYWSRKVAPHLGKTVLEVGSGIGTVTRLLSTAENVWTALEPDGNMVRDLAKQELPEATRLVCGSVADIAHGDLFETVLYIDVLEHIRDDVGELARAVALLKPGGKLVVLAPAHNFLFSRFDAEIGHFRRYSLKSLENIRPDGAKKVVGEYLDSVGALASLSNRLLLRQPQPTAAQVKVWDSVFVPVSRVVDPIFRHKVGKSVLVVWMRV